MVITFDVNETLLDLRSLDQRFIDVFGDRSVRAEWFKTVLRNSMLTTITGDYTDFLSVGAASLKMVADRHEVELSDAEGREIADAMRSLAPHPDVPPALEQLRAAGLRLAALTNSPQDVAVQQLKHAGIAPFFDRIMSVDAVRRFKPAREVYESGARRLGVSTSEMTMVAAHDFDIAGAMRAGCRGAYVLRPGMVFNPLYPEPDFVADDMVEMAGTLIAAGS